MQKQERALTIIIVILFLLIMFLLVNITYRNSLIEEQKQKITDLQIELENEKEITYKLDRENEDLKTILNNYTIQERRKTDV